MKKNKSYHILQIPHQELTNRIRNEKGENVIFLTRDETGKMMYSMLPVPKRAAADQKTPPERIAPLIAISIPYNAMLRQIYLSKHGVLGAHPDVKKRELKKSKTGPDNRDEFIEDLIYVDIRGMDNVASARDALLNGLILTYDAGRQEKYVLFERSASQARTGILVLINEKRIAALEPVIRCGLAPEQHAIVSKYAAYRALLMTSGLCVDVHEIGNCLRPVGGPDGTEQTAASVIVVSDFTIADWQRQCTARGCPYPADLNVRVATIDYEKPENPDCAEFAKLLKKNKSGVLRNIHFATKDSDCGDDKLFDGEGIVSAKLAKAFTNEILSEADRARSGDLSSFMIRMPFVKGVVHKVDFHAFFRELYGDRDVLIKDAFGQEHNIKDVQLILTVSMFKMFNEYQFMFPNEQALPQELSAKQAGASVNLRYAGYKWYWRQFHAYQHRLFICNSDERMRRGSLQTIANYQFLSTLASFQGARVVMPAVSAAWTEAQSTDALIVSYLSRTKGADACASEQTGEQLPEQNQNSSLPQEPDAEDPAAAANVPAEEDAESAYSDADLLEKCPQLGYTALFRERMRRLSLRDEFSYGHLFQAGMIRYLSGDLLQLLALLADPERPDAPDKSKTRIRVLAKENGDADAGEQNLAKQKAFFDEVFGKDGQLFGDGNTPSYYAPGTPEVETAVIDRNPHLSRQEHVPAARLSVAADSFRARYLGGLKGVVMLRVGRDRSVARLGGADFDGDLVRLFFGREYIRAVETVCKTNDEMDSLPLEIPGEKATAEPFTAEKRKMLIRRAAGSRIGCYSNAGFRSSLFAYAVRREPADSRKWKKAWEKYLRLRNLSGDSVDEKEKSFIRCAKKDIVMLSCLTGLDIDSVKTGLKPDFSINNLLYHTVTEYMKEALNQPAAAAADFGDDSDMNAPADPKTAAAAAESVGQDMLCDPYALDSFIKFKDHIKYKMEGELPKFCSLPAEYGTYSMVEKLPMIFKPGKTAEPQQSEAEEDGRPAQETGRTAATDAPLQGEWAECFRNQLWQFDKNGVAYRKKDKYVSLPAPSCRLRDLVLTQEEASSVTGQSASLSAALLAVSAYLRYVNSNFKNDRKTDHSLKKREALRVYLMEAFGAETGTLLCAELDGLIGRLGKETNEDAAADVIKEKIEAAMTDIIAWNNLPSGTWRAIALRRTLLQQNITLSEDAARTLSALCEFEKEKRGRQIQTLKALFRASEKAFCEQLGSQTKKAREGCLRLYAEIHKSHDENDSAMAQIAEMIQPKEKAVSKWMPNAQNMNEPRELPEPLQSLIPEGSLKKLLCSPKYWLALPYWLEYAYLVKLKESRRTAEDALKDLLTGTVLPEKYPDIAAFLSFKPAALPSADVSDPRLTAQEIFRARRFAQEQRQALQNADKQKYLSLLHNALKQIQTVPDPAENVDLLETKATEALAEIPFVLKDSQDIDLTQSALQINGGPQIPMKAFLLFCMIRQAQYPVSAYDTAKAVLASALGTTDETAAVRRLLAYHQMKQESIERMVFRLYRNALYGMLKTDQTFFAVADDVPDFRIGYLDGRQCIDYACSIPAKQKAEENAVQMTIYADLSTVITGKTLTKRSLAELFCSAVRIRIPAPLSSGKIIAVTTDLEDAAARAKWQRLLAVPFRILFVDGEHKTELFECAVSFLSLPPSEASEPEDELQLEQFSLQEAVVEAAIGTEQAKPETEMPHIAERYKDIAGAPLRASYALHVRRNADGTFCRDSSSVSDTAAEPLNQFIFAFRRFQRIGNGNPADLQQAGTKDGE